MQHLFGSPDGPVEVTLTKDGDEFVLEGARAMLTSRGQLKIQLPDGTTELAHVAKVGDAWWVHLRGHTFRWERIEPGSTSADEGGGLVAPMPGKVLEVLVSPGQQVKAGDALMVLEAMKMEHRIVASTDGVVAAVHFAAGEQVMQGASLLELEESN